MQKIRESRSFSKEWILARNSPKVSDFVALFAIDFLPSVPSRFSGQGSNSVPLVLSERLGTRLASDFAAKSAQRNCVRILNSATFIEGLPVRLLTEGSLYNPPSRRREIPVRA